MIEPASTILVVDDEEMMRELVSATMEMEGCTVEQAPDGAAALEMIAKKRPDLVLLDLNMPRVSGWDVIEGLKQFPSPPPVVVMSGMGAKEPPEVQAVRQYVRGYLAKPFTNEQLVKTVSRALQAAASAQAPPPPAPEAAREQRAEPRRDLLLSATLLSAADGTPAALGQILNLSLGGAQLDLGASLHAGMTVAFVFEIPGGHGPFRVTGRIQWAKDGKVGVSFVELAADQKRRLEQLIASTP
jgi:CheY-like chemotaxis protein